MLPENFIHVRLPKGRIIAELAQDSDYPGVDIEYVSDNEDDEPRTRPRVLIEYNREANEFRVLVWADPNSEDYSDEIIFQHPDFSDGGTQQ